ncbi:MAG: hypothetical protein ACXACB_11255 [Promethearchaeota archaeon]|jgi:hypothetical protein
MKCPNCENEMDDFVLRDRGRCNICGFDFEDLIALYWKTDKRLDESIKKLNQVKDK